MSTSGGGFRTFGIVGYGHFGQFLAPSLARHAEVLVTDADASKLPPAAATDDVRAASLDEVAAADAVILAVPYGALEGVLTEIRDRLTPGTVVMDVVSTKAHATELLETLLADHSDVLATHPLFGPPSMHAIEPGLRLVVTHTRGVRAQQLREFLHQRLGLTIVELSAADHDRAMAYMQSLPFFIARALVAIDLLKLPHRDQLAIPSFEKLAEIAAIEEQHTMDMFDTSQVSNPYANEAREHFLEVLGKLQVEIEQHTSASGLAQVPPDQDAPAVH